jgi:hypothetical protein
MIAVASANLAARGDLRFGLVGEVIVTVGMLFCLNSGGGVLDDILNESIKAKVSHNKMQQMQQDEKAGRQFVSVSTKECAQQSVTHEALRCNRQDKTRQQKQQQDSRRAGNEERVKSYTYRHFDDLGDFDKQAKRAAGFEVGGCRKDK